LKSQSSKKWKGDTDKGLPLKNRKINNMLPMAIIRKL